MAIFIANENGDWWGINEQYGKTLYILDTDKINPETMESLLDEWELDSAEDFSNVDKLEKIIWEHGTTIQLPINVSGEV